MLANFLEKSKPINFIVYLGLFFCFFFGKITFTLFSGDISLYKAFESILFIFLFLSVFFFFNFIVTKNKLTLDHSYAFYLFTLAVTLFFSALFDFKSITLVIKTMIDLRCMQCKPCRERPLDQPNKDPAEQKQTEDKKNDFLTVFLLANVQARACLG